MTDPEATGFDAYSESYRESIDEAVAFSGADHEFYTRVKARKLLELAARRVGDPRQLSFLDLGCGPGETDRLLEGRVARLTGFDTSAGMIEVARRQNPWAIYEQIEAGAALPAATASFDVCFAVCVFHHVAISRRAALVAEMARVTRPGGAVAVFEHNPLNPLTRRAVAGCEFDRDAELLRRAETTRLVAGAGLADLEAGYIVFFTRDSPRRRWAERLLASVPLGAQYVVSGRRDRELRS